MVEIIYFLNFNVRLDFRIILQSFLESRTLHNSLRKQYITNIGRISAILDIRSTLLDGTVQKVCTVRFQI